MSEAKEKPHYNHPAEAYLKLATGEVIKGAIKHHSDIASGAMFTMTPLEHRYLFCDWKNYGCKQVLTYTGFQDRRDTLGGSYHFFKCVNCKGLVEHNKKSLALQRNVVVGKDTEVAFDQEFLDSTTPSYYVNYLDPPKDEVYKYVEVTDGRQCYSKLVPLLNYQRFMYHVRGFSNHPDMQIKKK